MSQEEKSNVKLAWKRYSDNHSDSINYERLSDKRTIYEPEEDYHKPIIISNNYTEYE